MRRELVLALAAASVALVWTGSPAKPQPLSSARLLTPAASSNQAPPREPTEQTATPPTLWEPSIHASQGRDLPLAWLCSYLARSSRDDDRWEAAMADLSTPERLVERHESEPNSVGLNPSHRWRATEIEANAAANPLVDTSPWETLTNAGAIPDGHRTAREPTIPYSYRQADGAWLVIVADQRYASQG